MTRLGPHGQCDSVIMECGTPDHLLNHHLHPHHHHPLFNPHTVLTDFPRSAETKGGFEGKKDEKLSI